MNEISDLLDVQQVRNILTVSEEDLPDSVLVGYGLEDDLSADLDKKLENWQALTEAKHLRSLRLYVKYKASAIVALTAPIFVLKKNTDGSNEGQRSDRDGYLWLANSLNGRADTVMTELKEDLGANDSVVGMELVGKSTPARDPITQPREE